MLPFSFVIVEQQMFLRKKVQSQTCLAIQQRNAPITNEKEKMWLLSSGGESRTVGRGESPLERIHRSSRNWPRRTERAPRRTRNAKQQPRDSTLETKKSLKLRENTIFALAAKNFADRKKKVLHKFDVLWSACICVEV